MKSYILFIFIFFTVQSSVVAQSVIITRFAGNNTIGYSGDSGPALSAQFRQPYSVATDTLGNLYVADYNNNVIRKIDTSGIITTYAGNGTEGYSGDNGAATLARLNHPAGVAVDAAGNLYIADRNNEVIRKVSASGIITTVAGNNVHGINGDGGPATAAELSFPIAVAVGKHGDIYIADNGNMIVRRVSPSGIITRFAGNYGGAYTGNGGPASVAMLNTPQGICTDTAGNVYIADTYNNAIRKVNTAGIITTVAGNGIGANTGNGGPATLASLWLPTGVDVDRAGNIYIADFQNNLVRKVNTSGMISILAGSATSGYGGDGGAATLARLYLPRSVNTDRSGNLYICDYGNHIIRKIHLNHSPSFAGGPVQSLSVCQNSTLNFINDKMSVYDADPGQAESLVVYTPPAHGTLSGFPAAPVSNGAVIIPAGLKYTPAAGYIGTDAFTVRVTDGFDTAYTTVNVTVNPLAVPGTITGPSTVCTGGTITLINATSGGVWSAGNSNASVAGGVVTGIATGTTVISYTVSNACGPVSATKTITMNAVVNSGTISGAPDVCVSGSTTLSGSTPGGTWSAANTNATITAGGVVTGVVPGTNIITYTVTNMCGASFSLKTITINIMPVAGTITGLSTVCQGASVTLTNATPGGVWSSSNTGIATVSAGVVTGVSGGTCNISYTVTNACGAVSTTKAVTVNAAATPGTLSGPATLCAGATATITATVPGGTWSSSGNATVSGGVITGTSPGTATISYSITNSCGVVSATKIVTVESLPSSGTITGAATVCAGATTTLSNTATGGAWGSNNVSIANVSTAGVVAGVSAGTVTISYTVTNSCGTSAATKSMTVTPLPGTATISGSGTVCIGTPATLTASLPGGTWSSSNGNATVNVTGIVTGVTVGTVSISYVLTNGCGNTTATRTVTVNTMPVAAAITGLQAVCAGATITLTNATSGGTWASGSSSVASVSGGVITGIAAGTASISYNVTNSCGTAIATKIITVNPLPVSGIISGSSAVCSGSTISLTASAPGGVWSSTSAASVAGGTVTGIAAGTASISYTVTNICGTSAAVKIITVDVTPFAGAITGMSALCQGASTSLSASGAGGVWTAGTGATITSTGIVTGTSAGTTTVSYTVANACNTVMATKTLTINPLPVSGTVSGLSTVCAGLTVTLVASAPGGIWSAAGVAATVAGGTVTGVSAGTATISYTVSNGCGSAAATKIITVGGSPVAALISGTHSVCAGASVTLTSSMPGGVWNSSSSNAAIAMATATTGTLTGIATGTALLSYTISNTCGTSVATHAVTINPIPTITAIANQTICSGDATTATSFTGTVSGTVYTWVNSMPGIGLAATGTGNIPSFTATNSGIAPQTATIDVTPGAGGCTGTPQSFTYTVKPSATVVTPANLIICNGDAVPAVTFTGAVGGTTYTWVNSEPSIGLGASGAGNITSFPATGSGVTAVTANITVTPSADGCTGSSANFTIRVNPTPTTAPLPPDQSVCNTSITSAVNFTGSVGGTTWTWANSNPGIGLAASGIGGIAPFVAINTGTSATTATITFTPTANGCAGTPQSFNIIVNPLPATPSIYTRPASALCANAQFQNFGSATPAPAGTFYTWSVTNAVLCSVGADKQYCLISFPNGGISEVTLNVSDAAGTCQSHTTYTLYPGDTAAEAPYVIYYNKQFICLQFNPDGYVWGYDDAATLDSTIISNENNQSYYNDAPDTVNRHYWVMTNNNGCWQKAYYGAAPASTDNSATQSTQGIVLYPNPAEQMLNMALNGSMQQRAEVFLFEPAGRQVGTAILINGKGSIDVSALAPGMYVASCYVDGIKVNTTFIKR